MWSGGERRTRRYDVERATNPQAWKKHINKGTVALDGSNSAGNQGDCLNSWHTRSTAVDLHGVLWFTVSAAKGLMRVIDDTR